MEKLKSVRSSLEVELVSSGGAGVLITEARAKILTQQPRELLENLQNGNISAVEVLEAFQAKAVEESKRTNCITGFILEAKDWAKALDDKSNNDRSATDSMPLYGLPVSIKDMIGVKGMDSTLGLMKRVNLPSETDAALVDAMKKLGAVPFVMTNNPQTCMSFNCSNPVFGETTNPHNASRSCGGSSGGEGALIGGGGSLLGLGTDIAGSVRHPSHWCGIAAIKPTSRRFTGKGNVRCFPGLVGVQGTPGIMGSDSYIVVEATKALLSFGLNQYDGNLAPIPWRDELFVGTIERPLKAVLRIGWYEDLVIFPPTPGVRRAVRESVAVLKTLGHELVPYQPPDVMKGIQLWYDFVMADGGVFVNEILDGETNDPSMFFYNELAAASSSGSNEDKQYLKERYGSFVANLTSNIKTPADMCRKLGEKDSYVGQVIESWRKLELDLLVCPVWPIPAAPKGFDSSMFAVSVYTMLYNLLDFPCGVVPCTRETDEDQRMLQSYVTTDCPLSNYIKQYTEGATGMPIGVQFVALPFREETVCRIMLEFTTSLLDSE